jgi:hypothetical protein
LGNSRERPRPARLDVLESVACLLSARIGQYCSELPRFAQNSMATLEY